MLKNYITIALRNLLRHKLSTAINIFGLSISTTFCILILLFVRNETSFDTNYRHANEMFLVVASVTNNTGATEQITQQPIGLVVIVAAIIPVCVQAIRVSLSNPSDALHAE